MKNACAYIRVSTDKQEELSPDAQKRLVTDYCTKNNLNIVDEHIFMENGISGKKADNRPEFMRMIAMAKSKEHPFDIILVWKFSRFARNQEESIVYKAMLKKNHIDVVSVSEPIIDGPFGSLIERIIEWMDEYYSIRLSGEVLRGMTEKALRGGYQSRPPVGYISNKLTGIPEIKEPEADFVRMVYNKFLNGESYLEIAREVNALGFRTTKGGVWEQRSIKYMLENPFYYGMIRWNRQNREAHSIKDKSEWIISKGRHEPLITEEIWRNTQERIAAISRPYKSRGTADIKHWLSGIVKCSSCGASLISNSVHKGESVSFQCGRYNKGMCSHSHYIKTIQLEQAVLNGLTKVCDCTDIFFEPTKCEAKKPSCPDINLQLLRLEDKEQRIKQAYINGIDTLEEYKENKELIKSERSLLEASAAKFNNCDNTKSSSKTELKKVCEIFTNKSFDKKIRANCIRSIVDKIVYEKEQDSITMYFIMPKK